MVEISTVWDIRLTEIHGYSLSRNGYLCLFFSDKNNKWLNNGVWHVTNGYVGVNIRGGVLTVLNYWVFRGLRTISISWVIRGSRSLPRLSAPMVSPRVYTPTPLFWVPVSPICQRFWWTHRGCLCGSGGSTVFFLASLSDPRIAITLRSNGWLRARGWRAMAPICRLSSEVDGVAVRSRLRLASTRRTIWLMSIRGPTLSVRLLHPMTRIGWDIHISRDDFWPRISIADFWPWVGGARQDWMVSLRGLLLE